MQTPLLVTWKSVTATPALKAAIHDHAERLESLFDGITSCRVVVDVPNDKGRHGCLYRVCVQLKVPGADLVTHRDNPTDVGQEDPYVAISEAFTAARRQLLDYVRKRRGKGRGQVRRAQGFVRSLAEDHGFLMDAGGGHVYFHANAVRDGFGGISVGDHVAFDMEIGDAGPQARRVQLLHHT